MKLHTRLLQVSVLLMQLAAAATAQMSPTCTTTLRRLCAPQHSSPPLTACDVCVGSNQHSLRVAGCSAADVHAFCTKNAARPSLYKGVDLSYCAQAESTGTRYYAHSGGVAGDPVHIVAANGANIARLRLWVDPPYPNQTYVPSHLSTAIVTYQRCMRAEHQ